MINKDKLKGKIVSEGLSVEKLALEKGMHPSTLYRQINENRLSIGNAEWFVKRLNMTKKEAREIFSLKVSH